VVAVVVGNLKPNGPRWPRCANQRNSPPCHLKAMYWWCEMSCPVLVERLRRGF
jgi:hypothetical protein